VRRKLHSNRRCAKAEAVLAADRSELIANFIESLEDCAPSRKSFSGRKGNQWTAGPLSKTSVGSAVASGALSAERLLDVLVPKSGATSDPLPLVAIDEAARLGEKLGIERWFATSNVGRSLLNSPSATAGFYGLLNALLFHSQVTARTRELINLRIGWRTPLRVCVLPPRRLFA
jgi:hypothetical protein